MKYKIFISCFLFGLLIACNNKSTEQSKPEHQTENHLHISANKLASATDPVCKMAVSESQADTATYNGELYGFCSSDCKATFLKNPETFLKK